jgi:tRNA modification GTPase
MMKYAYYDTEEPIVALATPWGESALAVIRVSGAGSIELAAGCFSRAQAVLGAESGTIGFQRLIDSSSGELIDEVTVSVFRAPHGYTGEDALEICCHGSLAGIRKILEVLKRSGFRDARPGEFTLRAFMKGKLDLTRAEAVQEIVSAKSRKAHSLALSRLSGGLYRRIHELKETLVDVISQVELQLDYAEDEVVLEQEVPIESLMETVGALSELAETYHSGRMYSEGVRIALAGATNAGKSSLFNLFLKEDRSIVSEVHGTTRDYIESWISISGIPVRLYDTAGFRESVDSIEEEGIRRSNQLLEHADLVLYLSGGDEEVDPREMNSSYIYIWNKSDIRTTAVPDGFFSLSTVTGAGFARIEQEIVRRLTGSARVTTEGEVMIDSLRQKELLDRAVESLNTAVTAVTDGMPLDVVAPELQDAIDALGEITGEVTSSDILDRVFSGFCVGK